MTQEFIPYELALALKELDFDEPCIMCYYGISRDDKFDGLYLHTGTGKVCNTHLKEEEDGITAPTYSQAFKFFREKYGLNGYIQPMIHDDSGIETLNYHPLIHNIEWNDDAETCIFFPSWEQAELACLIKLIELVKEK